MDTDTPQSRGVMIGKWSGGGRLKVCVAVSEGGHLTEALALMPVLSRHDFFIISYDCHRVRSLPFRRYAIPIFPENLFRTPTALWRLYRAFRWERPEVVVSTGSEIAIPVFLLAKLFGAKTVYIETLARFETPSLTGRLLYPLADRFFVQNPESLEAFGPKAEYHGAVV